MEKLEIAYVDTSIVEQIWVYGTSTESFLIALVVPEKHHLLSWAEETGLQGSYEELCASNKVPRTPYFWPAAGSCSCSSIVP